MRYLYVLVLIILFIDAKADIGREDIIEFKFNGELYYMKVHSNGTLQNNDLCYYSYNSEYQGEVASYLKLIFENIDSILVFSEMIEIQISKMDTRYIDNESLYFFRNENKISINDLEKIEIESAFHGNTYGYELSPKNSKLSFDWVNDYEVERLFGLGETDMCSYDFYSIKGNFSKSEIKKMKMEFSNCYPFDEFNKLEKLRQELFLKNVFIISFCSC